jgi:hypothetical protein
LKNRLVSSKKMQSGSRSTRIILHLMVGVRKPLYTNSVEWKDWSSECEVPRNRYNWPLDEWLISSLYIKLRIPYEAGVCSSVSSYCSRDDKGSSL